MDPLNPNDPLWKLLGKRREPEVRSNFTAHVLREARNTPQERGLLARLRAWWSELAVPLPAAGLGLAAAAVVALGFFQSTWMKPDTAASAVAAVEPPAVPSVNPVVAQNRAQIRAIEEVPLTPELESHLESLDQMEALLAAEDTSALSDQQIAFLLY